MITTRYSLQYKRIKLLLRAKLEKRGENVCYRNMNGLPLSASYLNPPVVVNGMELSGFPSDAIQANTIGESGVNTLKKALSLSRLHRNVERIISV